MKNKTLEILVVEDNEKHMEDAKAEMSKRIEAGEDLTVNYATSYAEAIQALQSKHYDGVITDIFMPSSEGKVEDRHRLECYSVLPKKILENQEYSRAALNWKEGTELPPLGALVAEKAMEQSVPLVFCTDTYHHGKKTEPVVVYARSKMIPFIDDNHAKEGHAEHKKWDFAVDVMKATIEISKMDEIHVDESNYDLSEDARNKIKDNYGEKVYYACLDALQAKFIYDD